MLFSCVTSTRFISIHALREEGDYTFGIRTLFVLAFLSTPSARRATSATAAGRSQAGHFYPRPPRGGRLALCALDFL